MEVHSMYVPTTLNQPVGPLAPVGILTTAPPLGKPVMTAVTVHSSRLDVLDGQTATVTGTLRPGLAGRLVMLQTLDARGWSTVSRARTRGRGRFQLRSSPPGSAASRCACASAAT